MMPNCHVELSNAIIILSSKLILTTGVM